MRALLIYPVFPPTFWSYNKILELVDRKVLLPPLGMVTVAAILPQEWEFKLVDRNIRAVTEAEWEWAEIVILSGMIVQRQDLIEQIHEAKQRGKLVAVGGPYPTSIPHEVAEADFLILDEGEITIPMFVEALAKGETKGVFRTTEKPDVTITPIPRYDLLDFEAYDSMSVQFSRGCPFQCEFCDIIVLYGRKPRTKTPAQLLKELDYLYELGWRRGVFMVDDNFIGNKRNVKLLLKELKVWQEEHQYPFRFNTEASVDLAADPELMEMMVDCYFDAVFLGIETPDEESLQLTKKFQNTRSSLTETVDKIIKAGLRPMAGFIIGFDGEKKGAADRIINFVEEAAIPTALFGMLQALPNTALWDRLKQENRLLDGIGVTELGDQNSLMNFIPTRAIAEIGKEYVEAFWKMYDPSAYLRRCFLQCMKLGSLNSNKQTLHIPWATQLRLVAQIIWHQGITRSPIRKQFWQQLWTIFRHKPQSLTIYLALCATGEHFWEYRWTARERISQQLGYDPMIHYPPALHVQPEPVTCPPLASVH